MKELYQVVEVGPSWYQENIPCQEACPVKTNCRGYLNLAAAGEYEKAWELALDPNPLASICGSVCAAPCETACRRKEVDKPLSIRYVKKFLSDWTHRNVRLDGQVYTQPPPPVFGKPSQRIAIVGAGCAGLAAASDLAKMGFGVTIYDALDQAGGTALAGVPPFRLPREVIDRDVRGIVNDNVDLRLSTFVGRDVKLSELRDQFDAVLITAGCFEPNYPADIPNLDAMGVYGGIVFLERAYRGRPVEVGRRVVVLGGGYTAMDCSSTAWRLGAEEVTVAYRRGREEMVVDEEELTETQREDIRFVYLASPLEVLVDETGHARAVKFVRNKLGAPDRTGRRSPEPIPGSEFEIPCETVLLALSQNPDVTWLADIPEFRVKRARDLQIDPETFQTKVRKIFIAGDYRTGPSTIIEGVAEGRSAAQQIARFLDADAVAVQVPEYHEVVTLRRSNLGDNLGIIAMEGELARVYHNMSVDYDRIPRQEMPKLTKEERRGLFLETNRGYGEAQAVAESDRCLKCNFNIEIIGELCIICTGCVDVCPMDVIHMVPIDDVVDDGAIPAVAEAKKWSGGVAFFLDETACIRCALCVIRCPTDAITMNRYGTVAPSVGRALPKESIDDEIHLDLTVASRKAARPLPMYDPRRAAGFKDMTSGSNGNGNGHHPASLSELQAEAAPGEPARTH
jgi:NADPH-dependent glutamate synthase beta subunit-like oxidoreductase/ferredoxin